MGLDGISFVGATVGGVASASSNSRIEKRALFCRKTVVLIFKNQLTAKLLLIIFVRQSLRK